MQGSSESPRPPRKAPCLIMILPFLSWYLPPLSHLMSPTPGSLNDTQLKAFKFLSAVVLKVDCTFYSWEILKKKKSLSGPTPTDSDLEVLE